MLNWFINLNFIWQATIASIGAWLLTSLGAMLVFLFKKLNKNIMDKMLGLSAGIMLSAAFFSLLNPAIEISKQLHLTPWIVITIGIILGTIFLYIGDILFEKNDKKESKELKKRCKMLISSITLHNIPEGMVIGVAFASIAYGLSNQTIKSAIMLSLAIALQNFPEGASVSIPLRREGISRIKSCLYGILSGIVEPISAIIGAILVLKIRKLLPILLSFAAGAMLYAIIQELIPESQTNGNKNKITLYTILGFIIMMILDIILS